MFKQLYPLGILFSSLFGGIATAAGETSLPTADKNGHAVAHGWRGGRRALYTRFVGENSQTRRVNSAAATALTFSPFITVLEIVSPLQLKSGTEGLPLTTSTFGPHTTVAKNARL